MLQVGVHRTTTTCPCACSQAGGERRFLAEVARQLHRAQAGQADHLRITVDGVVGAAVVDQHHLPAVGQPGQQCQQQPAAASRGCAPRCGRAPPATGWAVRAVAIGLVPTPPGTARRAVRRQAPALAGRRPGQLALQQQFVVVHGFSAALGGGRSQARPVSVRFQGVILPCRTLTGDAQAAERRYCTASATCATSDCRAARQVGDRARHLERAVRRARAPAQARGGAAAGTPMPPASSAAWRSISSPCSAWLVLPWRASARSRAGHAARAHARASARRPAHPAVLRRPAPALPRAGRCGPAAGRSAAPW